jgi:hypothetical protein
MTIKNYLIEDSVTGRIVASGTAASKRDARAKTGYACHRYTVIEATAKGIMYQPIQRSLT